jgi:Skp family chaperone for outer membrane proteins
MSRTILALLLLLAPAVVYADALGFVNSERAISDCVDGKKAIADLKADQAAREKTVADAKAARKTIAPPDDQWRAQQERKRQAAVEKIGPRVVALVKKIAQAKHLSAVLPAPVYASPKAVDITDEVIRRYDAGEGKDEGEAKADETTKLREENARLKAQIASQAKGKAAKSP